MPTRYRIALASLLFVAALAANAPARADADYSISDGVAELSLGIDPGETMIWMNTFPVDPAGQYIDIIKVAYGKVGGPTPLNGQPVTILLYEDINGGSPQDAVLKWSFNTTVANSNTNVLNTYRVPALLIHGNLVAAALYKNTNPIRVYIGALDTTPPTLAERSYTGYAISLDPANLGAIPPSQWGPVENLGVTGNLRIEAHGRTSVDDLAVSLTVGKLVASGFVHLVWIGAQATYDVERASRPDFFDGRIIAPGLSGTIYDDATLNDGRVWFYRVR